MTETDGLFEQLRDWSVLARAKLEARDFPAVARALFLIRGTCLVFGYFQIAYLTGLGENVSWYATTQKNSQITQKKCVDAIWDALTTLEYMVTHGIDNTSEEQKILIFRLEATLKSFRDFVLPLTQTEIDVIVRSNSAKRDLARQEN
jgi:hypothetical protein